jgi:hypothetical protein
MRKKAPESTRLARGTAEAGLANEATPDLEGSGVANGATETRLGCGAPSADCGAKPRDP